MSEENDNTESWKLPHSSTSKNKKKGKIEEKKDKMATTKEQGRLRAYSTSSNESSISEKSKKADIANFFRNMQR